MMICRAGFHKFGGPIQYFKNQIKTFLKIFIVHILHNITLITYLIN